MVIGFDIEIPLSCLPPLGMQVGSKIGRTQVRLAWVPLRRINQQGFHIDISISFLTRQPQKISIIPRKLIVFQDL